MQLIGADALRRRLNALYGVPDQVESAWAEATAPILRGYIPRRTGATAASVRPTDRGVVGSPVVDFLDVGTRAHDIEPRNASVLKFQPRGGGQAIFRPRAHKPQTRGQHFKEPAMRQGFEEASGGVIIKTWNGAA